MPAAHVEMPIKKQACKTLQIFTAAISSKSVLGVTWLQLPVAELALHFHFSTVSLCILTLLALVSERKKEN